MLKITKYTLLLLFLIQLFIQNVYPYSFKRFDVNTGLSENTVQTIIQDHNGLMWFGTKDGLNQFDGYNFRQFRHDFETQQSIGNNYVRTIYQDVNNDIWVGTDKGIFIYKYNDNVFIPFTKISKNGITIDVPVSVICEETDSIIWIGTFGKGLFYYNTISNELINYNMLPFGNLIEKIFKDHSGEIWIGTKKGLWKYNRELNKFFSYPYFDEYRRKIDYEVLSIHEDLNGNIWVGTWNNGLLKLNSSTNLFTAFCSNINHIRSISEYKKNKLLIGSDDGLFIYDLLKESCVRIDNPKDPNSLSDHNVYAIYTDREGGIWIGTYFGGVNYLLSNVIKHYYPIFTSNSLSGKVITQFCEDDKKNIWIATADGGLNYFDRQKDTFTPYLPNNSRNSLSYDNIHALVYDQGNLWCGTFSAGIDVYNTKSNTFKNYRNNYTDTSSINDDCIFALYKTSKGKIYVGTRAGLNLYDKTSDNFTRIKNVSTFIYDIKEDHIGYLWVATYTRGAYRYDPKKDEWRNYRYDPKNRNSICFNKLTSIYLDEKQRLWFTSEGGGICKYNYETDDFTTFNSKQGLPSNVAYGILDDALGNIWISSNSGIIRLNPNTMQIKTYTKEDGLQSNQFNYKSSYKSSDGVFFFGGISGFNTFNPNELYEMENKYIPSIVITGIDILTGNNPKKIVHSNKIKLKHYQSSLSIHFASLSYKAQQKNNYAYILNGLDNQWTFIGNQRNVSFINLPHGKYTFQVKGSNNDGLWNENGVSIEIEILPPLWQTKSAYFFYTLIILIAGFYFTRLLIKRSKKKQKEQMSLFRIEKEKEIYNAKIEFFTNVAHEIRTPVSLIKAPLECIKGTYSGASEMDKENLYIIEKNTDRLLELINQLLDFRKIEKDAYKLNFARINIKELLINTCYRFKSTADQKNIIIEQQLPEQDVFIEADCEAITKVISNLLSNALKFAKKKILVSLNNNIQTLEIAIKDDGIGIPEEMRENVFKPFYQVEDNSNNIEKMNGTGIGLALCKKLIEQHDGDIYIENQKVGTSVIVKLRTHQNVTTLLSQTSKDVIEENRIQHLSENNSPITEKMTILVVEDNEELQTFMHQSLSPDYRILLASNGKVALEQLEKNIVDLIISDIIMPEMDGLQLTNIIKQDAQYCHIPVIILSAKTNTQDKIIGLDVGADSYLEKPFSIGFLRAQINSLIENRKKILERFSESPMIPYYSIARNKKDEEFIDKLNKTIDQNLLDNYFSIEKLSSSMSMSQSNLQRKIKGISGMVPNDYIRIFKLKKAAQLLLTSNHRINEICYMTGFSSPSYFSKCFLKQFGVLPNEFIKKNNSNYPNLN